MQFDDVLARFQVKKRKSDSAQCVCPCHNDKQASLGVSLGDKGIVLHCFAGCDPEQILSSVGLTMNDLFYGDSAPASGGEMWRKYLDKSAEKYGKKVDAIYHYHEPSGEYAFTRVRYKPKQFMYGRLSGGRFEFGLGTDPDGKKLSRKDFRAVYSSDLRLIREAASAGGRIFVVEGEKDVDTLTRLGYLALTSGASGDWRSEYAEILTGAEVVILADNDAPGAAMARKVSKDLQKVARTVRTVVPTPDIEKGDVSDYFDNGHTRAEFEELLQTVTAPAQIQTQTSAQAPSDDLSRFTINGNQVFDYEIFRDICEKQKILVLGGSPFLYDNGVFVADYSGVRLKSMIRKRIYPELIRSNTIKRVYELFLQAEELMVKFEDCNQYPPRWINFRNGFYDPESGKMFPHDPEYRALNQCPHDFDPAGSPSGDVVEEWLRFIVPAPDDREMILQYSGYCMTRDVSQQKFLILNGEGGSGKSTLINLIQSAVGDDNTSNISLVDLTQRFASYGLMGKLLNSCADLEITALEDTSTLKKALGEDALRGEQKGKDAISFRNYAKMIYSTNELPTIKSERTNGFYRRLLILPMNRTPGKRRAGFGAELQSQVDYFIHLSMAALRRMYQTGYITESESSKDAVKQLKFDSDTVEAWLTEETVRDVRSRETRSMCWNNYETYCESNDRQPLSRNNFYKAMRSKGYPEVRSAQDRYFSGISLDKTVTETVTVSGKTVTSSGQFYELEGEDLELPFD